MNKNTIHYLFRIAKVVLRSGRLSNAIKLSISVFLSKFGVVTHWNLLPQFISIEPTNICNLRCPQCPVGMRLKQVKAVNIELNMVEKLLDELHPALIHVILYFQGEPLLGKNFIELVQLAHGRKLLTSTSTNAQLITDNLACAIVRSGLDKLIISIDGTTQETYEIYRVGGKLEKALCAVEMLVKWKKELRSLSPLIEVQFLVLKTNEHQMDDMRKLVKRLGADKLVFKSAQLYDYEQGSPLLTSKKKYSRYKLGNDGKYHLKTPQRNRCKRLWKGAVINSRGEILPCCFDKESQYIFGNIRENSFADAWNSNRTYRFRRMILVNRRQFEMCRNCTER